MALEETDLGKWRRELNGEDAETRMWAAFHLGEMYADGAQVVGELLDAYFREADRQASSSMSKAIQRIVFASAKTCDNRRPAELALKRIGKESSQHPERAAYLADKLGLK